MAGAPSDSAAQLANSLFNNPITNEHESGNILVSPVVTEGAAQQAIADKTVPRKRRGKRDRLPILSEASGDSHVSAPASTVPTGPGQRTPMEISTVVEMSEASSIQHASQGRLKVAGTEAAQQVELPQQQNKDKSGKLQHSQPSSEPCIVRTPPPTPAELYRRIPAKCDKTYGTEATFGQALVVLVQQGWLELTDDEVDAGVCDVCDVLASMNPEYEAVIVNVPKLMKVDFSPLLEEDLGYAERTEIDKHTVWMMTACLAHYKMDYGLVLRYLGGEFTAEWRNVKGVLLAVAPYVSEDDLKHVARILDAKEASPFEFAMQETEENKEAFIRHGNGRSVTQNMGAVYKTLVKEVRNHHLMTFMRWTVRASSHGHHVPQEYIPPKKPGAKGRFIWNGSIKRMAAWITMNEATPTRNEAPITFGYVYMAFCIWIYNLRIQFPNEDILLGYIDISSCFRYPRIFADLVGAFGFIVGPWYFAANAMVFGSVASASSWEPLRRAISAIAMACFARKWLVKKHKAYLDMVGWEPEPADDVIFVQATKCTKNTGILDENGMEKPSPHNIYVDDDLIADTRRRMPQALVSAIEAIFTVMGAPCVRLRACAIALDKWQKLYVSYCVVLLGLLFNTRTMTVGVTDEYRAEVLHLLTTRWHKGRDGFTVSEMEQLIGKLGRIGQAYRPIYHLMPHMYGSVAYALRENKFFLTANSRRFREMLRTLKMDSTTSEDLREINFARSRVAKMTHGADEVYRMPPSLKEEIRIITALLMDHSIKLEMAIAHIIPRDGSFYAAADACKRAGGGWSTDLRFWWHYEWPEDIQRRARLPNNKNGQLISINVLEMACVILNFAAAIVACFVDGISLDAFPMLANDCDNTSACSWVNVNCKTSMAGRALGRIFVGMLMSTKLGIQANWISTHMNKIADEISRVHGKDGEYDYSQLLTDYPVLSDCRVFQPSDTLLGMILGVLRGNDLPCPLTLAKLEPSALGSIISSDL